MPARYDPAVQTPQADLRAFVEREITAGRTISLAGCEAEFASLRASLPGILEEMAAAGQLPAPPVVVPGYTLLGEIGAGGSSTVYLARHEALQRHVALKVAHHPPGDAAGRELTLREARALARLRHPHVLSIHDVIDTGGTLALALEYIDGMTLTGLLRTLPAMPGEDDADRLRKALGGGPALAIRDPVEFFVRTMRDVAHAVQAVHDVGLLHLDIKPANVLVRRDGQALLADFGIVREGTTGPAAAGGFVGTPFYAAPEQLRGDPAPLAPTADVYSLGITLYELLARRQPLAGRPIGETLQELAAGRVPPLRAIAPTVPAELAGAVQWAIEPDPQRRCPSAAAFADRLDAYLRAASATVATPAAPPRRVWAPASTALLALLLPICAVLALILYREQDRIRAQHWRETKARHAEVVHRVCQSLATRAAVAPFRVGKLREVLAEDPDDHGALACLAFVLATQGTPGAAGGRVAEPLLQRPGLGLQLLQQRAAQRRSYFTDAEVVALDGSQDPSDLLLLALDRLLLAKDSDHPAAAKAAAAPLERLMLSYGHNPLPVSLKCWFAALTGDRRGLQDASFALQQKWPDDENCCVWQLFAWKQLDPKRGEEIGTAFLARHPGAFEVGLALSDCLSATDHDRALALLATLRPETPEHQHQLKLVQAVHLAASGKLDEARARCPAEELSNLYLLVKLHPAAFAKRCEELLASPEANQCDLYDALDATQSLASPDRARLQIRLARHGHALYPDRPVFQWFLLEWHAAVGEFTAGAALARQLRLPATNTDRFAWAAALCLGGAKDWAAMAELCQRWLAAPTSEERHRALFYAGVAAARLGLAERAYQLFEEHLAAGSAAVLDSGKRQHYAQAYIERIALRMDPDSPPSLRSEAEQRRCQREIDTLEQRQRGEPWWLWVMAEWQFRRGDLGLARTNLERARANLGDPRAFGPFAKAIAPENLPERIDRGLARLAAIGLADLAGALR